MVKCCSPKLNPRGGIDPNTLVLNHIYKDIIIPDSIL